MSSEVLFLCPSSQLAWGRSWRQRGPRRSRWPGEPFASPFHEFRSFPFGGRNDFLEEGFKGSLVYCVPVLRGQRVSLSPARPQPEKSFALLSLWMELRASHTLDRTHLLLRVALAYCTLRAFVRECELHKTRHFKSTSRSESVTHPPGTVALW